MRQLLTSLVSHGKIVTTEAQAKALKRQIERLISRSKDLGLVTRRKILALFPQKTVSRKFLDQIVPQFTSRVGGYVRVIKLPHRRGDHAPLARVEFVEEIKPSTSLPEKKSSAKGKISLKAKPSAVPKPKSVKKPANLPAGKAGKGIKRVKTTKTK